MSYEQASTFLAKCLPFTEGAGYINIHWSKLGGNGKPLWQGRAFQSVSDAIGFIGWLELRGEKNNIYVCMSRQSVAEQVTSKAGYPYLKAIRLSENAIQFKGWWIDLDYKGYNSPEETVKALAEFLTKTKLPSPSAVVSTGGGMHCHWTISEAITLDVWQPVAFALAEACKQHGLKADVACTVDAARILRVPETRNCKYDPPRKVTLLRVQDFDYLINRITDPLQSYKVTTPTKVENELSAGIGAFAPIDIARVIPNCPYLQESLRSHGADHKQPLWAMSALLSTFTTQGRALFHLLSNGHPEYSRESSDEIFDRKERERKAKNIGWPTCASIESAGSTACASCPHRSENKSPLHFTKPHGMNGHSSAHHFVASESNIQYLPDGYRHKEDMKIVHVAHNEEGVEIEQQITNWPAYDAWLEEADDGKLLKFFFTTQLKKQPKIISMPTAILASYGKLSECLSGQGCEIPKKQQNAVGDLAVAWMSKLKEAGAFKNTSSFGWNIHNGEIVGFNYGGQLWRPDGHIPAATINVAGSELYSPIGDLSTWKDAAKLITDTNRNELNAILATAFAAPLVQFTGQSAFLVSAYSPESGTQKTSAMKAAQAVWGHSIKSMQSLEDTNNAVFNKLGLTSSLPMYWDEIGVTAAEKYRDTVKLLMQLTSGREKARLDSNAQAREVKTWSTILTCTSNSSLKDYITSQSNTSPAALNRIIEFCVPPGVSGMISDPKATSLIAKLQFNYGQAGYKYAQFLGNNFKQIEHEMQESLEAIHTEIGSDPSERFWLANICCILLGAKYARQLDLVDINSERLKEFLLRNFVSMRGDRQETITDFKEAATVAQIITQFMDEIGNDHILKTNKIHERGQPRDIMPIGMGTWPPRQAPYVQIGITSNVIRVNKDQFARWLREKSIHRNNHVTVLKQIEAHEGVTARKAAIGAGLNIPETTQKLVLDFDANKIPDLQIEQVTNPEAASSNVVLFQR